VAPTTGKKQQNKTEATTKTDTSVLRAEGLYKEFGKRPVVQDVSLELHQGEIVGLLGPNGAGKTTTFSMIIGFLQPTAGEIKIDDNCINNMPIFKRARLGIGYLSQEASIFRKLSIEDNIRAVLEAA
jgi:lipopolysaccharide export system ATP-binding protein